MIDPKVITEQASINNLVPSVLWAIGQHGSVFTDNEFENEVWARTTASKMAGLVRDNVTIERALSVLHGGDPNAYQYANNVAKGFVDGVLGLAGSRADYGLQGFSPSDRNVFTEHANDVHDVFDSMSALGGVVSAETVQKFAAGIAQHVRKGGANPTVPARPIQPPIPSGPRPQDVAPFVDRSRSLGIDPEHFIQHFPFVGDSMRKMMGKSPTLEDYAPMSQMDRSEMLQHLRSQPHPIFPDITTGQYHDAYDAAMLHAGKVLHTPIPSTVARMARTGMNHKEIGQYYDDLSVRLNRTTQPQEHQNASPKS